MWVSERKTTKLYENNDWLKCDYNKFAKDKRLIIKHVYEENCERSLNQQYKNEI